MADVYATTADVVTFNDTDSDILVSDVLDRAPLIQRLAAFTCSGIDYKYTKLTANPSVGFRSPNDGIENTDSTYSQVSIDLAYLDASFAVDKAVAAAADRGADFFVAQEARNHLSEAMKVLETQVLGGTVGGDASGFNGFADQSNLNGLSDAQVVNAGGSTANTGSSIYLVRTGESAVRLLWGEDGVINISDRMSVERAGSSTGRFMAWHHEIAGWAGLVVSSTYDVVRIANITEDAGDGATDDLIAEGISLFPVGRGPTLAVMNRRSLKQIQESRTATNPTGAPAPFPTSSHGVEIVVTDNISSTEALLA